METTITEDDERKPVVDRDGDEIGTVADVDYDVIHVRTEGSEDLGSGARQLESEDDTLYEIEQERIAEVTDTEVTVDLGE